MAEYELVEIAPPAAAVEAAAASLARAGAFLLGELHGVAQTPRAILGLVSRLEVGALALEWAYDELDDVIQPVLTTGLVDLDALWALPPDAEVFSGDGRFTDGHVALLEHLAPRLERIVLLDRFGSEGAAREAGMAQRLVDAARVGPVLAVLGVGHVLRSAVEGAEPVALLAERELARAATGVLWPSSGTCWFHGERTLEQHEPPRVDAVIPLGVATAAVVPQHPLAE